MARVQACCGRSLAQRRRQADRAIVDRLIAIEAVLGLRRHPHRVLRRRHEAAAADFHVQYAVGRILQRAPGMTVSRGIAVRIEVGITEVHRGGQFAEIQQVDVFTVHAVRHQGQVVWIAV